MKKGLSAKQLDMKSFRFLEIEGEWLRFLGNMPYNFTGIVYGESGQGKSEFCIKLAKVLIQFDKVAWIDYEQGHGADLQAAMRRNEMHKEDTGKLIIIDPLDGMKKGAKLINELDIYLSKRSTPKFVFINSIDYLRIKPSDILDANNIFKKHSTNKGLIFISHSEGKKIKSKIGREIEFDGQFGIYVKKFIAYAEKNRFGGKGQFIIWNERVKSGNESYF